MTTRHLRSRPRTAGRRWLALLAGVVMCLSIRGLAYEGMEEMIHLASAPPTELTAEEQATISVFEKATRSVVFIANTAKQRDPWSFNLFDVPQGSGSGFI